MVLILSLYLLYINKVKQQNNTAMDVKELTSKFDALNGAKFISINGYENSQNEVANVVINTNISTTNAKKKDLEKLKSLNENDFNCISEKYDISLQELKLNYSELLDSLIKNIGDYDNRTDKSKALSEAFKQNNNGTKVFVKENELTIYGFLISKTILTEGEVKKTSKKGKTYIKNSIKEYCEFKMLNYKTYKIKNISNFIVINKEKVLINI